VLDRCVEAEADRMTKAQGGQGAVGARGCVGRPLRSQNQQRVVCHNKREGLY
jgi:hypothetical protein